jgi:hypothetical protein
MRVYFQARRTARHRARGALTLLALSAAACNDAVLDLAGVREPATIGEAGMTGSAGVAAHNGDAGSAGEVGLAGSAGAESLGPSLYSAGFCGDAVGDCLYQQGSLECSGEVGETGVQALAGERARLLLDMTNATELRVAFELCEPRGYVLNIGDSPSNNGGGGDAGDFEHDAEILIYGADLTASSSDLGYEQTGPGIGYHPFLLSRADYVASLGCSSRVLHVRDQYIADGENPSLRTQTPTALRIDPSADEQGAPDAHWYLGVNRVVSSAVGDRFRAGSGLVALRLCFALAPAEPPSRTGP